MFNAFAVQSLTALIIVVSGASLLPAQFLEAPQEEQWARDMIDRSQWAINYKSVARGQDVVFRIHVSNLYKEEMQITALATSCGCISWDENRGGALPAPIVIASGKDTYINLRLDTIRHHGEQKNKRAMITFMNTASGKGGIATITAEGYIRADVVLQPGSVHFGSVEPNKGAEQHLAVNYAGRNDWKLLSANLNSPYFTAEVVEKLRGNGLVNYDLVVRLKDTAPVGNLRDQLVLVTDDVNNPQIPIQVDAKIEPDYVVNEANFGDLIPGKPKKIPVFVRYTRNPPKPFRIEKFERTRQDTNIKVEKSADSKAFHQIMLTFTPPDEPGAYDEEFFLTVSGREDPITFKARGNIKSKPEETGDQAAPN